jgi:hypothetical protein
VGTARAAPPQPASPARRIAMENPCLPDGGMPGRARDQSPRTPADQFTDAVTYMDQKSRTYGRARSRVADAANDASNQ